MQQFLSQFHDVLEVAFAERRRIDGIEQLPQLGDTDLNELALRRNGIPGRHSLYLQSVYAGTGAGDGVTAERLMPAAA